MFLLPSCREPKRPDVALARVEAGTIPSSKPISSGLSTNLFDLVTQLAQSSHPALPVYGRYFILISPPSDVKRI
jgi:hypothetical protein